MLFRCIMRSTWIFAVIVVRPRRRDGNPWQVRPRDRNPIAQAKRCGNRRAEGLAATHPETGAHANSVTSVLAHRMGGSNSPARHFSLRADSFRNRQVLIISVVPRAEARTRIVAAKRSNCEHFFVIPC